MPFELKDARKLVEFSFEGTDWDGAKVTCYLSIPLGVSLELAALAELDEGPQKTRQIAELWMKEVLHEWDFVLDGEPVPKTWEGFERLDQALAGLLIEKWIELFKEQQEPSVPLDEPSPNGVPLAGPSMVTEIH